MTSRRRFLSWMLGGGAFVAAGVGAWRQRRSVGPGVEDGAVPSAVPEADAPRCLSATCHALGSRVTLTLAHPCQQTSRQALADATAELRRVEQLMSLYRPDSQLCQLNRHGVLDDPHPQFVEVLRAAGAMSQQSDGAFDVTVQPLWQLYAAAQQAGQIPCAAAIAAARQQVDWRRVEIGPRRVRLHGPGTAVTLNGIAQGFAADRITAVLRRHGIEHALVDTGEIGALGSKDAGAPWTVGIQHPRRPDAYVALAKLDGRCLATSGDYATAFSADYRHHHVFDPQSGRSPEVLSSVSVAAATATEADALATALLVLGPTKGLALLRRFPTADAFLVFKDGATQATAGFPLV